MPANLYLEDHDRHEGTGDIDRLNSGRGPLRSLSWLSYWSDWRVIWSSCWSSRLSSESLKGDKIHHLFTPPVKYLEHRLVRMVSRDPDTMTPPWWYHGGVTVVSWWCHGGVQWHHSHQSMLQWHTLYLLMGHTFLWNRTNLCRKYSTLFRLN